MSFEITFEQIFTVILYDSHTFASLVKTFRVYAILTPNC